MITIDPELEARLRENAEAEGLTLSAYLERLMRADQAAEDEIEALTLDGLNSGPAIEMGADYWARKHRQLDDRIARTRTR
jgi:uncharacterized protein YoaH (UPF0181 family)